LGLSSVSGVVSNARQLRRANGPDANAASEKVRMTMNKFMIAVAAVTAIVIGALSLASAEERIVTNNRTVRGAVIGAGTGAVIAGPRGAVVGGLIELPASDAGIRWLK
jgi:hypothetical protein